MLKSSLLTFSCRSFSLTPVNDMRAHYQRSQIAPRTIRAALQPLSAALKTFDRSGRLPRNRTLRGTVSPEGPTHYKFRLATPLEGDGQGIEEVFLVPKYSTGYPLPFTDAQTVQILLNNPTIGNVVPEGEGYLQIDTLSILHRQDKRDLHRKLAILIFWVCVVSMAVFGGFRYTIVHGTVRSELYFHLYFISLILSLLFFYSAIEFYSASSNIRNIASPVDIKNIFLLSLFLIVATSFLFQIPASAIVKTLNAWLGPSAEIKISGPIT